MSLRDQIAEAEAKLAQLRRQEAVASCAEVGHRWKSCGGRNAGCGPSCRCSVPVHKCETCGDYDYGYPAEAEIIAECRERSCEHIEVPA